MRLNLEKAREKKTEIRLDFEALQKESLEIENQIAEIERNRKVIGQEMQESVERESTLQENIQKAQEALTGLRRREAEYTKDLEEIRLNYANLSQKDGFLAQNIRRLEEETGKLEAESRTMLEKAAEEKDDVKKKQQDIVEIQKTIAAAVQAKEEEDRRIVELQEKKEALSADHKEFFEKRDQLSDQISLMDKECFRLKSQMEKLEEHREAQISYMWEEYEMTYSSAKEQTFEEPLERSEIKKAQAEVRNEIKKLGNVNVNAIEEYKELSERHTFLNAQHEDLVEAEKTLLKIIDELDIGMRHQFEEKFAQIREEFDKAFKELFGGGKGTIELDEEEDILEAGIRIISQPPGKKLQNMMQLSGGEKALTAIALLFAIQNLKPSPFCLLDEIEAALDDSNVTRYARYLHKLTKNTQFIIITHRRGTMTAADRLYGITMQEKGVSTLVSVNLIENDLDK